MGLKLRKLDNKGFSSHLLVPVLVISLIAGMGAYVVTRSNANTAYSNGAIYTGESFVSQDGSKESVGNYETANQVFSLNFSPDGKRVSYWTQDYDAKTADLHVANSDGSNNKVIYTIDGGSSSGAASWSKDGTLLAFSQPQQDAYEQQELITLKPDGTGFEVIPTPELNGPDSQSIVRSPVFYSDNQTIIYTSHLNGTPKLCKVTIKLNDGSCIDIKLPTNTFTYSQISVSADNKTVLLTGARSNNCTAEGCAYAENVYKVDSDTGTTTAVTNFNPTSASTFNNVSNPTWSPDGTKIAYGLATATERGTYVANPDGSNAQLVSKRYGETTWQPYATGTTQPSLPYNQSDISCRVDSTSAELVANKVANIKVAFKNNTPSPVSTNFAAVQRLWKNSGTWTELPSTSGATPVIAPGTEVQVSVTTSVAIPYDTTGYDSYSFRVSPPNTSYFGCWADFTLPKPAVTISGTSPRVVAYNKPMTIAGTAAPKAIVSLYVGGKGVQSTTSTSTGAFSTAYTPKTDMTFYAQVFGRNSASHVAKVRATVNGSTLRTVTKGTNVTVTGTYTPGKTLVVYMRKPGDPAGKYPRTISVKTTASGTYSFTFKADTKKVFYVQAPNGTKTPLYTVALK